MTNNRAIPEGFMTVGEVAKKMGITVRTLQYYDKEGLFSPSLQSEGGRRLYTDKDLIKLHQILSMKHLGFSLDDIKNRLVSLDTPEQVANALEEQADALRKKIESLSEALRQTEALREEVLKMQSVDFKKYMRCACASCAYVCCYDDFLFPKWKNVLWISSNVAEFDQYYCSFSNMCLWYWNSI